MMVKKLLITFILFSVAFGQAVSISGFVLSEKGKGIKKAIVTLKSLDGDEVVNTKSDKKGAFKLENISPAKYILTAKHKKSGEFQVQLEPNENGNTDLVDLELTLSKEEIELTIISFGVMDEPIAGEIETISQNSITFSGTVVNEKGKGLKEVTLSFVDENGDTIFESETTRKGEFSFPDLVPKIYTLIAYHKELGTFKRKFIESKNGYSPIDDFKISLPDTTDILWIYTFFGEGPLSEDPTLTIPAPKTKSKIGEIIIEWAESPYADIYELYENDQLIYEGESPRYMTKAISGVTHCFKVRVKGKDGLFGPFTDETCGNSSISTPMNLASTDSQNTISLQWLPTEGAISYNIYRDDKLLSNQSHNRFKDQNLLYGTLYQYRVSAIDNFGTEGLLSHPVQSKTRELIQAPILSSLESADAIVLIWNEVEHSSKYAIYRDGIPVIKTTKTTFIDSTQAGSSFCYEVTAIDSFQLESIVSNRHCGKVQVKAPSTLSVVGDAKSIHLSWDTVEGSKSYQIYKKWPGGDFDLLSQSKMTHFRDPELGYDDSLCYAISSIDQDGVESDLSNQMCASTLEPPELTILGFELVEPSKNGALDAREDGKMRFSIQNIGESPAHEITLIVYPDAPKIFALNMDTVLVFDTLNSDEIKHVDLDVSAKLKIGTAERSFSLYATEKDGYHLKEPHPFSFQTVAVVPPKILLSDFAISNEFGVHYIPKNEVVTLTGRIQNVGEGLTENVKLKFLENQSYSMTDFNSDILLDELKPGAYSDFTIEFSSVRDHFSIPIKSTDYLGIEREHMIELELMKHYRGPKELTSYPIGTMVVDPYPEEMSDVDIENHIPIGKRNSNALAIVFGIESYDNPTLPKVQFANRDVKFMRAYLQNTFGMDDYQVIPSKIWHMESGPTLDDLNATLDPHQGDLRHRIVTSNKYSGVESLDIYIYFNGLGKHSNGKPFLLPKDANPDRDVSQYGLEEFLSHLSMVSVLNTVRSITVMLDIKWVNKPDESSSEWEFPYLSEKVTVLASSEVNGNSDYYTDMNHSYFTYTALKGLSGAADDGDGEISISEFSSYIQQSMSKLNPTQKPHIISVDNDRIIVEYYGVE